MADDRRCGSGPGVALGMPISRRRFVQSGAALGAGLFVSRLHGAPAWAQESAGGILDSRAIPKYEAPLVIPPAMPQSARPPAVRGIDYYEIAVRQFRQQVLPAKLGLGPTTVWSYGSADHAGSLHYPALTIEAQWRRPVRVRWINGLVDRNGAFLPHLLPIDQTLHWANPPGGVQGRDGHGTDQDAYRGPVPIVTHLHGGHTSADSDGYPEAWYLPQARNIPPGYARTGSLYHTFQAQAQAGLHEAWSPSSAVFEYENDQRVATMWYHDHTLGMTRANVYAGPAGFYLLRGGPGDADASTLPGPAPAVGDAPGHDYFEIPIAIQDRSFTDEGQLFYPAHPRLLREPRAVAAADSVHARLGVRRPERCGADLEPGVLRQRDRRQRPHVAVARRPAAPLPVPLPERVQLAVPDPSACPTGCRSGRSATRVDSFPRPLSWERC